MKHTARITTACIALAATALRAEPPKDAKLYDAVLHPIVDTHCISCHGAEKVKGKLRLDSREAIAKGGKSGKALFTAGKSAESEFFVRIALPHDNEDVMPPDDKEKLTKEQIELFKWWIEGAGASLDVTVADARIPDNLKAVAEAAAKLKPAKTAEAKPVVPAGPVNVDDLLPKLDPLKKVGAIALPIAQNTRAVMVEFQLLGEAVGDEQLGLLAPIAPELEWLNLGRTKVTDAGLAKLQGLKNLKRLYLDRTGITDAGVANISGLAQLEYLNLYGSKVGDGSVDHLKKLSGLKKLYVWQTGISSNGVAALRAALPNAMVDDGWGPEDDAKAKAEEKPAEAPKAEAKPADPAKPAEPAKTAAVKFDDGSCCHKAEAAGKKCDHGCCVEAAKAGKVCTKCNPKAKQA